MKAEEAVQEWRRGLGFGSLRARIFAVNLLAVIVLAIMLLYLDTVRSRLLDERTASLANEAITVSRLVTDLPPTARAGSILRLGMERGTRVRLYAGSGERLADNWLNPKTPRFVIEDPAAYGWRRSSAKAIDRALDAVLGFRTLSPYVEPAVDTASLWPELARSSTAAQPITDLRRANDGSLIVTAAAPVPGVGHVLLTDSADDLASILRRERLTSAWLLLSVMALTLGLSLYLARTIVRPLRMLAIAAHRVRLGRSREVVVPRLPDRSDEIGALARAISDMSTALRRQIDATEAFAADVAHELKNPLASLRSAVEVLDRVEKPELRAQLLAVIRDDVGRIDRLITDIADASRLDAELSRTGFQPIDVAALADGLVAAYGIAATASNRSRTVSVERAGLAGPVLIEGDANRLAQVLRNLIDNAISFSPDGGRVTLALASRGDQVELAVSDQGPGVPTANRRDIFRRFYSERPEGEDFGRHSGLAGPVLIEGDANRLAQVLRNLIDNAISFSPDGGRVTLALASRGDQVELAVSDQGPGVPTANRRDIFRRFYSERPEGEDFGRHSGLGLSIAGAIVVAHGGQITVEDAPGGGALFRVLLPAA